MTIVDGHCHAWRRWPYQPPVPDPESRGRVEQLLFEMDRNGVAQAVLVCARLDGNADNVDYVLDAAARHPGRLHVLPDLDCAWSETYHRPGAAERLRALAERGPLCGLTHYLAPENDGWLRSSEAHDVFAAAAEHDLILSVSAPAPSWHADLRRLASAFPTVPVLLHHLGPSRTREELDEVIASSAVPSIAVKVSGFYYGAPRGWDFPFADALEVVRRLYEAFGPHRLCWGSDFPVCLDHITYRQSLELLRTHCDFIPREEQALVLGGALAGMLKTRRPPAA